MRSLLLLSCLALTGCQQLATISAQATNTGTTRKVAKPESIAIPVDHTIGPVQYVRMTRKPYKGAKATVVAKRAYEWRLSIVNGATEGWFARDEFITLD